MFNVLPVKQKAVELKKYNPAVQNYKKKQLMIQVETKKKQEKSARREYKNIKKVLDQISVDGDANYEQKT